MTYNNYVRLNIVHVHDPAWSNYSSNKIRHLAEELFVHLPLPKRTAHEYSTITVTIDSPQFDIGFGFDRGSSWRPIDQRQLAK